MRRLLLAGLAAALLAGCGSGTDRAEQVALAALATPVPAVPSSSSPTVSCNPNTLTASLRPPASMPSPGALPAGSFMAKIKRRGYLRAGVNASFLGFGYLNPARGNQFEGFEIDLVREIAKAIFGSTNPKYVKFEALAVPQRIPFVRSGQVDIVADAVTITCARKQQVDFSTVYYDAAQRVLVPITSPVKGIGDMGGMRVCATAGSAPLDYIKTYMPMSIAVPAPQAIDCLVYLQEGRVDAISTDDSILLGFTAQDPYTKIVGPRLTDVPYGMAISQAHPDFVRFVNGVLARLRADRTWQRLYQSSLGRFVRRIPSPPKAQYDG